VLWSYRLDAVEPVIGPFFEDSYVQVAPNIRMVGRRLTIGKTTSFDVKIPGVYALYGASGQPLPGEMEVDGQMLRAPFNLLPGSRTIVLRDGPRTAFLLPENSYSGLIGEGSDDEQLFDHVYD